LSLWYTASLFLQSAIGVLFLIVCRLWGLDSTHRNAARGSASREWFILDAVTYDSCIVCAGFIFARKNNTDLLTRALQEIAKHLKAQALLIGIQWERPGAVLIDDCVVEFNSIRFVFSIATLIALCTWHFARNLLAKMKAHGLGVKRAEAIVQLYWSQVFASPTAHGRLRAIQIAETVLRSEGVNATEEDIHHIMGELRGT
jgi:hypothetical protein